jgi:hypothetical protein
MSIAASSTDAAEGILMRGAAERSSKSTDRGDPIG